MMLKPDKGLLEDLIAQAEGLNEADYEAQSFAVMRTALQRRKKYSTMWMQIRKRSTHLHQH